MFKPLRLLPVSMPHLKSLRSRFFILWCLKYYMNVLHYFCMTLYIILLLRLIAWKSRCRGVPNKVRICQSSVVPKEKCHMMYHYWTISVSISVFLLLLLLLCLICLYLCLFSETLPGSVWLHRSWWRWSVIPWRWCDCGRAANWWRMDVWKSGAHWSAGHAAC